MDSLHLHGIAFIQILQAQFKGLDELMQFITKLGDPKAAFLVYYPLAYILSPSIGVKVIWVGAICEFFNTVFKWILYGHRPYWWVHETPLYGNQTPVLDQFRMTCETGPGSPSGHCMVTAAVLYILLRYLIKHLQRNKKTSPGFLTISALWLLYMGFMSAIGISRCFIATHFPHQVFAGVVCGAIIGTLVDAVLPIRPTFLQYWIGCGAVLGIGFSMFGLMQVMGMNPMWSVSLALKWCAQKSWIHLDTTPFSALVKDGAALFGAGFAALLLNRKSNDTMTLSPVVKVITLIISLTFTQASEYISIPQDNQVTFYVLMFTKFTWVVFTVALIYKLVLVLFGRHGDPKNA